MNSNDTSPNFENYNGINPKKTQEETAVLESGETWASVARSGSGGRTIKWQIAGIHLFVPSNKLRPIMTIQTRYIWF
jgi:hypothetical protein